MSCDFFFSSRRRHTRCLSDWSSDVCSSDLDVTHVGLDRESKHQQLDDGDTDHDAQREPVATHLNEFLADRKSTRLNSSHLGISYAVFCLKKKKNKKKKSNL